MGKGKKSKKAAPKAGLQPPAPAAAPSLQTKRRREEDDGDADAMREELEFQDPYVDEYEEESFDEADGEDEHGADGGVGRQPQPKRLLEAAPDGEELEYDPSAYHMYHAIRAEWPCLSFDFVRDSLGTNRTRFPHTVTAVAGTQADRADRNKLTLLRLSQLHKQSKSGGDGGSESSDDSSSEDDSDVDEDPVVEHLSVPHAGGVNRVRSMPQRSHIMASWADTSSVHIWNLEKELAALNLGTKAGAATTVAASVGPAFTLRSHPDEGFAMDWSPVEAGQLATGDCAGNIYMCRSAGSGWASDASPFVGHAGSVEDLQWSPTERTVFASASADNTVCVWDTRRRSGSMLTVRAHESDVNVIAWNRGVSYLLASGADDGSFKVWDLRAFSKGKPEPVAHFSYHKEAVTSLEWHPTDDSMLAVAGADHKLTVWDLSVEADDAEDKAAAAEAGAEDLPPQLMFVHQGQRHIKELHYHPQIPGVLMSTAEDGFNVFKPALA